MTTGWHAGAVVSPATSLQEGQRSASASGQVGALCKGAGVPFFPLQVSELNLILRMSLTVKEVPTVDLET